MATLKLRAEGHTATRSQAGDTVKLPIGVQVTLIASSDSQLIDLQWKKDDNDWAQTPGVTRTEPSGEKKEGKVTFTAATPYFGKYSFTVKGLDNAREESPPLTLVEEAASGIGEGSGGSGGDTVSETAIGEYDGTFALVGGAICGALVTALVATMVVTLCGIEIPTSSQLLAPPSTKLDGSYAERIQSRIHLVGVFSGFILLVIGAFLASLEVRGRLTRPAASDGVRDALSTAVDGAVKGLGILRFTRATVVVVFVGALIVCVSLVSSQYISATDVTTPTETTPATPSSSETATSTTLPQPPITPTLTTRTASAEK